MGRSRGSWKSGKAQGEGRKMQSWKNFWRNLWVFPRFLRLGVKIPKMAFAIILLLSFCRTIRQEQGKGHSACHGSAEREGFAVDGQGVKRVKGLTECCKEKCLWIAITLMERDMRELERSGEGRKKKEGRGVSREGALEVACVCFRLVMHLPGIKRHEKFYHTQNWLYSVISSS